MNPKNLRQLSRTLVRKLGMLETSFGDLSLPPVQIHALIELDIEPCSVTDLAEKLKIDKSNASRTISNLSKQQMAETISAPNDKRIHIARLTAKGKEAVDRLNAHKDAKNQDIIDQIDADELIMLEQSLIRYNKAMRTARLQKEYTIRELTEGDDKIIANVIRNVSAEYGLTADKGFSVADPHLDNLSQAYSQQQSRYWVIEQDGRILGGAGVAPLKGEESICELQKMYFLPELRGKGLSRTLALKCFKFAREQGFTQCYLETTDKLSEAVESYKKLGFEQIQQQLGDTGHNDCEVRMLKEL
ncbi:helix-turn-helix domain-containing GNAT family N-acetyltransferase [Vibrio sp. JC009]|uniref:bifunctional helix-turn-helix transcriptional regulator/GNAT family N-acetyltransferase n=1 Tax=Vibrio sp. JC009 TaxID=2912314 RepID=UPI0023B0A658|nr:helix-turn-helix domain-containing GNAT family N-acetyltransferase [Vibrio sp. JC009]WED21498.1 helix-turn-helix domain-containing GNAT family N-acetyltransferase [Vibrio sp. JC009]